MLNWDIFKRRFIVLSSWGFEATVVSVFLRAFAFFFLEFCATIPSTSGLTHLHPHSSKFYFWLICFLLSQTELVSVTEDQENCINTFFLPVMVPFFVYPVSIHTVTWVLFSPHGVGMWRAKSKTALRYPRNYNAFSFTNLKKRCLPKCHDYLPIMS